MQQRVSQTEPLAIEKVIASLSYLTSGGVGFLWLIIALITKNNLRPFLKYHIFQSIFFAILLFLLSVLLGFTFDILGKIPFLTKLVISLTVYPNTAILFGRSLIEILYGSVILYLVITTCQGKYSRLPWVSEIVEANVRTSC